MQASDWRVMAKGMETFGLSYRTVMTNAGKVLVYGAAQTVIPVFSMDSGGFRHGVVVAAGRAGLARAVGMADIMMFTSYVATSSQNYLDARVSPNALFWASGGSFSYGYRVGVCPGSSLDRADVWAAMQQIGVSRWWALCPVGLSKSKISDIKSLYYAHQHPQWLDELGCVSILSCKHTAQNLRVGP